MFALLFTVSHAAIFINAVNAMAEVVLAKCASKTKCQHSAKYACTLGSNCPICNVDFTGCLQDVN